MHIAKRKGSLNTREAEEALVIEIPVRERVVAGCFLHDILQAKSYRQFVHQANQHLSD